MVVEVAEVAGIRNEVEYTGVVENSHKDPVDKGVELQKAGEDRIPYGSKDEQDIEDKDAESAAVLTMGV